METVRFGRNGKPKGMPGRPRSTCNCAGLQGAEMAECLKKCQEAFRDIRTLMGCAVCKGQPEQPSSSATDRTS